MTIGREKALERGMELVARLHEETSDVTDSQAADPQVRKVFEDLRSTLRVPIVNYLFRALAKYPGFLETAWFHVRPHLRTRAFEVEADRLRAQAPIGATPDGRALRASAGEDLEQVRSFTETIYYVLPKLLMIATAFDACLPREEGEEPRSTERTGFHEGAGLLPLGVADGTVSLPLLSPRKAPESVRGIFDEILQFHHHPGVATYYRALGNWPEFLAAAWAQVKPLLGSPEFNVRRERLIAQAEHVVRAWVEPLDESDLASLGISGHRLDDLRAVLTVFRFRIIPDLLLDVGLLHAMLEGPAEAQHSRFSVAEQTPEAGFIPQ